MELRYIQIEKTKERVIMKYNIPSFESWSEKEMGVKILFGAEIAQDFSKASVFDTMVLKALYDTLVSYYDCLEISDSFSDEDFEERKESVRNLFIQNYNFLALIGFKAFGNAEVFDNALSSEITRWVDGQEISEKAEERFSYFSKNAYKQDSAKITFEDEE